jgi:hypothetical protein
MGDTPQNQPGKPGQKKATGLPPAQFIPDLETHRNAITVKRWYWIGALPSLPTESCDLAGFNFPKVNELVERDGDGQTTRLPMIGALVQWTREDLDRIRTKMARTVVRFYEARDPQAPKTKDPRLHRARSGRKGQLITIPTAQELQQRREAGLTPVIYQQSPFDEPVAAFVFAQLCADQDAPDRGAQYPLPVSKTGIEWGEDRPATEVA